MVYLYQKKEGEKVIEKHAKKTKIGIRIIYRNKDFFKDKKKIVECYTNYLSNHFEYSYQTFITEKMKKYINYNLKVFLRRKEKIIQNKKQNKCLYIQKKALQELLSKKTIKKYMKGEINRRMRIFSEITFFL